MNIIMYDICKFYPVWLPTIKSEEEIKWQNAILELAKGCNMVGKSFDEVCENFRKTFKEI